MDNGNHGVLHGSSLPEGIAFRHDPGSFFWCLWWDGGSQPRLSVSFPSLFIVIFLLLNGVPWVGTCPISPPLQLLGVVVKAEKHGYVRHKALNAVMAAFPSNISIFSTVPFCFSTFPVPWNDLECHYQWQVVSFILSYIHAEEDSPHRRGGVFPPHGWGGVLLGLGPRPNVDIDMGLLVF